MYGRGDRGRHRRVGGCEIAQRAVRLDVAHRGAGQARERHERADLRGDHSPDFANLHRDDAAAEAFAVGIARMSADDDTAFHGQAQRPEHRLWVAGMAAAGDVGAGDAVQH